MKLSSSRHASAWIFWGGVAWMLSASAPALAQEAAGESPGESESDPAPEVDPAPDYVSAQENVERARFLFGEGVACIEAEDWPCAERAFRQTMELRDAPSVRYNLALAVFEQGRLDEAVALVASVIDDDASSDTVRAEANTLRDQLRASAARLSLVLSGGLDAVRVRLDGREVPAVERSSFLVAAGPRVVTVERDATEVARSSVTAVAGETHSLELEIAPAAIELAVVAPDVEGAVPLEEDWRFWLATGGGLAVVAIVTAIIVVVATSAQGPIVGDYEPGVLRWD